MIDLRQITKYYGGKRALNQVDLSFEPGRVYGIVGENGAGKTTLFKCIAGLERYSGSIESTFPVLKNHLGFLPTIPFFFSKITGKEYIQLLGHARNLRLKNIADKNIFDLPLHEYAHTYSTGMKKKLALTALLLQKNEVFILDEPFNGVDIHSNIVITEIILRLKSLNKTILISSHIFSTLEETCDQIHLLNQGNLVKTVDKSNFKALDREMRDFTIGNLLDRLDLA